MEKLKELRLSLGKSGEEMSKILNISNPAYYKYENGKAEPSIENLIKLADFYNVSLDYLVNRPFNNSVYLNDVERSMLEMFREMSKDNQKLFYAEAKGILLAQN